MFLPYSAGGAETAFDDALDDLDLLSVVLLLAAFVLAALAVLVVAFDAGFFSAAVDAAFAREGFFAAGVSLDSVFLAAGFFFGPVPVADSDFVVDELEAGFVALEAASLPDSFSGFSEAVDGPPRKSITPPTLGSATF